MAEWGKGHAGLQPAAAKGEYPKLGGSHIARLPRQTQTHLGAGARRPDGCWPARARMLTGPPPCRPAAPRRPALSACSGWSGAAAGTAGSWAHLGPSRHCLRRPGLRFGKGSTRAGRRGGKGAMSRFGSLGRSWCECCRLLLEAAALAPHERRFCIAHCRSHSVCRRGGCSRASRQAGGRPGVSNVATARRNGCSCCRCHHPSAAC